MCHNDVAHLVESALHIVEFNLGEFESVFDVVSDIDVFGLGEVASEDWESLKL